MAAKLLVSQRNLLPCLSHSKSSKSKSESRTSSSSSSTLLTTTTHGRQSRIGWNGVGVGAPISTGPKRLKVSPVDVGVAVEEASSALLTTSLSSPSSSLFLLADTAGYSLASYYTSLGLFVISVPGLWSLIKRSVKSKVLVLPNPTILPSFLLCRNLYIIYKFSVDCHDRGQLTSCWRGLLNLTPKSNFKFTWFA